MSVEFQVMLADVLEVQTQWFGHFVFLILIYLYAFLIFNVNITSSTSLSRLDSTDYLPPHLSLSLTHTHTHTNSYRSVLLVGPLGSTQGQHKTDEYKFLLVSQHWCVYV